MRVRLGVMAFSLLASLSACVPPPPATAAQTKKEPSSSKGSGNSTSNPSGGTTGDACGTITEAGLCAVSNSHKIVKRCESGKIVTQDCTNLNKICSLDSSSRAQCSDVGSTSGGTTGSTSTGSKNSPAPGPKPGATSPTACAGNIPATGICTGNKMQWCEKGKVNTRTCSSSETCTYGEEGATYCSPNSSTTPPPTCPGVPDTGICSGNQVKWCVAGKVETRDCGSISCQYGDDGIPYCPINGCGSVPDTGTCDGTVMKWCEGGTVRTDNCTGGTCAYSYEGPTYCDTSGGTSPGGGTTPTSGCGDVPSTGICDGNTRKWCEGGTLHTDPCVYSYCEYSAEGVVFCNYIDP